MPEGPIQAHIFPIVNLGKSPGVLFNAGTLSNASFDQYTLKLKVTLYHNGVALDLTPYIMQLKTHMAMGEPSGKFTIQLTFQKRWDKFIQPQDYVEIQFSRYLPDPPIMMRGLVNNIRRTRIMDGSGKLHRVITVNGENFGKIWRTYAIQYLIQEPGQTRKGIDNLPISGTLKNAIQENYGIGVGSTLSLSSSEFMKGVTDRIINEQIKYLQQVNPQIPLLKLASNVLSDYQISLLQINQEQGNLYAVVKKFGNAPWCEWFIDDFTDGPIFFYRNTPFKDKEGNLIFKESLPDKGYFLHPEISDIDIIEEDVGHTDDETYSYFFTYPALFMQSEYSPKAYLLGGGISLDEESSNASITNPHVDLDNLYRYGFKDLQVTTIGIPVSFDKDTQRRFSLKLNQWLVRSFNWTQFMLNGTIHMKGNEHMRIGRYFTNTSTKEEYYIESVEHTLTIGQVDSMGGDNVYSFLTTVGVTRGRAEK